MRSGKPIGSAKIYGSLEVNAEVSIHKVLTRASDALGQPENGDDEMSANNLGTLLRQVTEVSTREIENLINELHGLRKKLETDGDRIHNDLAGNAELSQGVMQLTTIISDTVKKLPSGPPSISR